MSAVGLGDRAVVGELVADKIVAKEKVVNTLTVNNTLTVSGLAIFNGGADASSLDVAGTTDLNGIVAMANSQVFLNGIPSSDPGIFGRVWRSETDLKVSIG